MRKVMLLLTLFSFAGSLWAADPIIGNWKLNIAKSKLSEVPKSFTESYREIDGDQIELTTVWIGSNGSPNTEKIVFPAQGGVNKFLNAIQKGRHEIETRISPGEWYM